MRIPGACDAQSIPRFDLRSDLRAGGREDLAEEDVEDDEERMQARDAWLAENPYRSLPDPHARAPPEELCAAWWEGDTGHVTQSARA